MTEKLPPFRPFSKKATSSQEATGSLPPLSIPAKKTRPFPPVPSPQPESPSWEKPIRPTVKSKRPIWILALIVFLMMVGTAVGLGVGILNYYLDQLPEIPYLEDYNPWMPSRMFSADTSKTLVADFFNDQQNREVVPLAEIPDYLKDAVIALEDYDFYNHPGISPKGFIRAAYQDVMNWNRRQGGSTLTMQLAEDLIKNKHLPYDISQKDLKSFRQKINEVLLALQIEKRFTKDEILEIYLNQVFMGGNNISGVARAAEYYFGKEISELDLKECALFAGMLQGPNAYLPSKNPEAAQRRTDVVLQAMLRRGFVTEEQMKKASAEPFQLNTKGTRRAQVALYPYFSNAVRRQFVEQKVKTFNDVPIDIYGQGVDIESTLDVPLQEAAESALRHGIVQHEHRRRTSGGKHWGEPGYKGVNMPGPAALEDGQEYDAKLLTDYDQQTSSIDVTVPNVRDGKGPFKVQVVPDETWLDEFDLLHKNYYIRVKAAQEGSGFRLSLAKEEYVQGALIVVRPSTGEVLAQVGGYDFNDKNNAGQFIRTVQATTLQPGSSFKPLLYAAALASTDKKWSINSTLQDIRKEYWAGWVPSNFYNRYYGSVTMLYSLTHSLNAASVWLLDSYKNTRSAGIEDFRAFCRQVFDLRIKENNLSIALGTSGTTPMELSQAYSVLANGGNFVRVHMVNKVYQRRDTRQNYESLLYEFKPSDETQERLSPQIAYLVTYMLHNVIDEGTGQPAADLPFFCAGKTGTTDDCTYAWFAGYSKDILCIVYMGYDDFTRSLGRKMTGAQVALPIWMEFMNQAYKVRPEFFGDIEPPPGIVFKSICTESNALATPDCPNKVSYPFTSDHVPKEECSIHGQDALRPYRKEASRLLLSDM